MTAFALARELTHLVVQRRRSAQRATRGHPTSSETSSEPRRVGQRADRDEVDARLGVRRARSRARCRRTPRAARGRRRARRPPRTSSAVMLSSRIRSTPALSASATSASVSASTSIGRAVAIAERRDARRPIPPAIRRWFSLRRIASYSPSRWLVPPPHRTAYFSSARRPGRRLARVEDRRAGSLDELDVARGQRRDAAEPAEQVERGPLAGEDRARGALDLGEARRHVRHASSSPVGEQRLDAHRRVERLEHRLRDREPATTPGSSSTSSARQRRPRRARRRRSSGRRRRRPRERGADDAVDGLGGQFHCSITGSPPGRRTTCPAKASSSVG